MKIELIAALFLGIAAAVMVARSPRLFWPVLIVANIFGNGPRLFGYFFWDEWLTGFAVIGALLCILIDKKGHANDPGNKDHKIIFIVWAFYMVAESFVGMFLNDDIRITRWILFYSLLILIFLIMHFRGDMFPFPRFRRFAAITLITSVLYFLSYLAHGMMIERILGVGEFGRFAAQFETEGILWSGSATAVFPTLIAMPVAIILMNDRSFKTRMLALLSIFIMMVIAFYYDSRMSWLVILGSFLLSAGKIRLKNILMFALSFVLVFSLYVPDPAKHISEFFYTIFEGTQALWSPGESDVTRKLQMHAGFLRLTDNPKTFFVGDGVYSHRFTIAPHINDLYLKYLPEQKFLIPGHKETRDDPPGGITLFRTTAFTALLVDTGVAGMLFFTLSFVFMGLKVFFKRNLDKKYFLFIILVSYMWMTNNNISEIILLYLFIMPMGLIEQLAKDETFMKAGKKI